MDILRAALVMLEKHPLCDNCLGRQFGLLGHGVENSQRGHAIKLVLTIEAHALVSSKKRKGLRVLRLLAENGFFGNAREVLQGMKRSLPKESNSKECYLCANKFRTKEVLVEKAFELLKDFEYSSFLVGIELPSDVAEREDEFRAEFAVDYGENMRNEFGRAIGKELAQRTGKTVEFRRPEIVVLADPFRENVRLQVNPLFVSGRYRKLVRGIPQSKWFCSSCRGRGCEKCGWTGKMYQESVQEIVERPILEATGGLSSSFHASGREDIDARMLGRGRPFVIEIARPRKRFLNLIALKEQVNTGGDGKVKISDLRFADKNVVRSLKKCESTQKVYRLLVEFAKQIGPKDLRVLQERLTNLAIRQQTPLRVLHRRADMTREKYIYEVNVKKLSPKKAELKIRCQGGLYVKELVTGDEGRTIPSVSEILCTKAKPLKLDVLKIAMED